MNKVVWKKIEEKKISEWNVVKTFELPDGQIRTYDIHRYREVVQIVAVTKEDTILVIEQYRTGPEEVLLDLPGGGIEKGENAIEAGQRELLEETGYIVDDPLLLGTSFRSPTQEGSCAFVIGFNARKVQESKKGEKQLGAVYEMTIEEFKQYLFLSKHTVFDVAAGALALVYITQNNYEKNSSG